LQRQEAELRCELGVESSSCDEELSCCEEEVSCCEEEVSCSSCREADETRAVDAGCPKLNSLSYGSDSCGCSSQPTSVGPRWPWAPEFLFLMALQSLAMYLYEVGSSGNGEWWVNGGSRWRL
jgi:hypothetical protein